MFGNPYIAPWRSFFAGGLVGSSFGSSVRLKDSDGILTVFGVGINLRPPRILVPWGARKDNSSTKTSASALDSGKT